MKRLPFIASLLGLTAAAQVRRPPPVADCQHSAPDGHCMTDAEFAASQAKPAASKFVWSPTVRPVNGTCPTCGIVAPPWKVKCMTVNEENVCGSNAKLVRCAVCSGAFWQDAS
jgi:hypothetical protein